MEELFKIYNKCSGYTYNTDVSTVISSVEDLGYKVIATPIKDKLDKNLSGTNNITEFGQFDYTAFDSNKYLDAATKYTKVFNGYPYIIMLGLNVVQPLGISLISYPEYNHETKLKNLWYPNIPRTINTYTYDNYNSRTHVASIIGGTSYQFSPNGKVGANGYYSISQFSDQSGHWGFVNGSNASYIQNHDTLEGQTAYLLSNEDNKSFYWRNTYSISPKDNIVFYIITKYKEIS